MSSTTVETKPKNYMDGLGIVTDYTSIIIVTAILVLVGGSCLGTGRFIIAYQNPGYIYTALVHIGKELLNILCPMGINCRGSLGTFQLIGYYYSLL